MLVALEITGSYKGMTGHDHHTRSIVRALHAAGVEIKLNDLPQWSPAKLPTSLQDSFFDQFDRPIAAAAHVYFCMPHQVTPSSAPVVNYTMFEADRIPRLWVELGKKHDAIVVPANSCRQAWIDSGVPSEKVHVVPLGVDSSLFTPGVAPIEICSADGRAASQFRVRFLNCSDAIERKNLLGLLQAWLLATNADDDALLILKPGFYSPGARSRFWMRINELERTAGKNLSDAAPITWIGETYAPQDMPALYASATHYISASRGEGFDLAMVEAGVSGLQLIAPRHSAYLDYLNEDIAHLIPVRTVDAHLPDDAATGELFAGAHWWEPDLEQLGKTIRAVIDCTIQARNSARGALSQLSWPRTASQLERLCRQARRQEGGS